MSIQERLLTKFISIVLLTVLFQACNLTEKFGKESKNDTPTSDPKPTSTPVPNASPSLAPIPSPSVTPTPSPTPTPTSTQTSQFLKFDESKIRTISINSGSGQFTYDITQDLDVAILSSDDEIKITNFETDFTTNTCEKMLDNSNNY